MINALACRTVLVAFLFSPAAQAAPVLQILRDEPKINLLRNGDFEQIGGGNTVAWASAPKGFRIAPGEGRYGSQALRCDNSSGQGWFGASQTIELAQTEPRPIVVHGWSKAVKVNGGADSDYSLYGDLTYTDGTTLWGQTGKFRTGTHDWERRQFIITPQKPVRQLTLHCLFRHHSGTVWFDDVGVEEIRERGGAFVFEGLPVKRLGGPAALPPQQGPSLRSADGLELDVRGQTITRFALDGQELSHQTQGGFLARDVASGSDFFPFSQTLAPELGLALHVKFLGTSNHVDVEGRVTDTTGKDRAVTLLFALPLRAVGWSWGEDIRSARAIPANGELTHVTSVACGATGTESLYPLAAIWNESAGIALGIDMGAPAVFRIGYHSGLEWLFIAYDFGLVKETEHFLSSADFRFVIYRFDPAGGFRAALQKYMGIFPDYFTVRSHRQGLWMPFTAVSKVQGWEDFGFRYHEGNNDVAWDDQHGVLSFRYTEPMTWWMPMKKELPRTLPEALRVRDEEATNGNSKQRRMAEISRVAAMYDEAGSPALLFRDTPWANGAVWSLNPNPFLGVTDTTTAAGSAERNSNQAANHLSSAPLNAASIYWNDQVRNQLYGPDAKGRLDGEYLDSLEGYVTADLNFRREHFRSTTVPLTFDFESKQPALFKGLAVYEFTRWMSEDVHRLGKLMFANGVPYRFTYLCPWLDVLGTETDWLQADRYHPASLATMDLWRSMSGAKPYLLLMNTDYDQFTSELVEKYFQRALFYGMWPGFFSHNAADNPYWQNPHWYERDRPLFRKYLPLIRRVAEAGWQPVPNASSTEPRILIERFGPGADRITYFTLYNDTAELESGIVSLAAASQSAKIPLELRSLLGAPRDRSDYGWRVRLAPGQVAVWQLAPEITLHTNFEAGSAGRVEWLSPTELRVHVLGQANEMGRNRQANWYYFRLDGTRGRQVTLHLTDFVGEYNFVQGACAMNADTIPVFSEDGEHWQHFSAMKWDDKAKEATLDIQSQSDALWVAHVPPYTFTRLQRLLDEVRRSPVAKVEVIGQSVEGRNLHLVTITDPEVPARSTKCVWLIARQHAWETGTSFVLEGALRFLISDDEQAGELRRRVTFHLVPTMDPDGLAVGHVRFNSLGYDLNRHWPSVDPHREADRRTMPEIWSVKKVILAQLAQQPIDLLLNLHNDEANEYMETEADEPAAQAVFRRLFRRLTQNTTFDPHRELVISANPPDTTTSLWAESHIPAGLMEQRIGTSPKLGRRVTVADRLEFGRKLMIEMAQSILKP
jgi:hypothetical protein